MSRATAWAALRSGSPTPLREVDRIAQMRGLDARDTALARKLVGLEVRRRGTLRAVVQHFLERKAKPDLMAHLHLGMVQILYLDRIPPHAAVNETLGAVRETLGPSKTSKVNAILRNVLRALVDGPTGDPRQDVLDRPLAFDRPVFHDPVEHYLLWLEDAHSLPAHIGKRWEKRFGREQTEELARHAAQEPPLVLRVLTGDMDEALGALAAAEVDATRLDDTRSILVPSSSTETALSLHPFQAGHWIVQGAWASRAADAVGAKAGETILDLCAAPGGKTAVLASSGAKVVALDHSARRLERLRDNALRLGLDLPAVACDGTRGLAKGVRFDAVLVDAPCTNTGVLAARPEARWRFGPASLKELVVLQERLLREAADRVKPGGRLIWSTCSLEPEENERLIEGFLKDQPSFSRGATEMRLPTAVSPDGGSFVELLA